MYVRKNVSMYLCMKKYMYEKIYVCRYKKCMYVYMYKKNMYVCMYKKMYVCMYVCTYDKMYVC